MKYTQKKETGKVTVTFKMTNDEWATFESKVFERTKNKYNVPGFRKGHVPKSVIVQRYGNVFFEDTLYDAAQEYYTQFLDKNSNIKIAIRPTVQEQSVKFNADGLSFAIKIVLQPEVTLGQYKGLTLAKSPVAEVTDSDVNAEIERMRKQSSRLVEVTDRAVAQGDTVDIDYCGKIDGVAFEGGTAANQSLEIGSHAFIEGFEEQLVGMNIGETRDINVTFPEDYHAEELKGKPAVFTVTVNGISYTELPALDDDFAKDVSEFSTLAEYIDDIRRRLAERNANAALSEEDAKLLEQIVGSSEVVMADEIVDDYLDKEVQDFAYRLHSSGMDLQRYFELTGSNLEAFRAERRPEAEKSLRTQLVMDEVIRAESVTADDSVVEQKIREYAAHTGETYEKVCENLGEDGKHYFENQALIDALFALLRSENKFE